LIICRFTMMMRMVKERVETIGKMMKKRVTLSMRKANSVADQFETELDKLINFN